MRTWLYGDEEFGCEGAAERFIRCGAAHTFICRDIPDPSSGVCRAEFTELYECGFCYPRVHPGGGCSYGCSSVASKSVQVECDPAGAGYSCKCWDGTEFKSDVCDETVIAAARVSCGKGDAR